VNRARRLRQGLQADPDRDHAERDVDREQPWPRADREDRGSDARAERERRSDHERVVAKAAAQHVGGVDKADQRSVHAHDAAGAQSLQRAGRGQAGQRPCQGAAKRGQREQHEASDVDALVTDDFAERPEREQRRNQCDLIDVDHPDRIGRADAKIGSDGGKGNVGDRRIQRSHRQRGEDRCDRPAPEFGRQPVHGDGRWF
jgi:hypothetical protein